jgi:hypothetical protein
VADDLVQRLRAFGAKPYDVTACQQRADTFTEAADALARKDAEIAAANAEIDELVRALKLCTQRTVRAEARVVALEESTHYANGVAELAMKHRDAAEARVREAPVVAAEFGDNGSPGRYPYAVIALTGDVAKRIGGKPVALVLLDTEEAK